MIPTSGEAFQQNVSDYIWMFDHRPSDDQYYIDDLTSWIAELNGYGVVSVNNNYDPESTIEKWKENSSIPWLVAAIIEIPASDPSALARIAAAEKVKPKSPAFVTLTYHVARLLIGQGKADEARAKADALLAMRDQLPLTAMNEIKRLRMSIARNLAELLEDAQRTTLGFTDSGDAEELPAIPEASPRVAETNAPQPTTAQIPVAGSWGEGNEVSAYSSGKSVESGRGGHLAVVEPSAVSSLGAETPKPQPTTAQVTAFGFFHLKESGSSSGSSIEIRPGLIPVPGASSLAVATPIPTLDPYTQTLRELAAGPLFDDDGASVLTRRLPLNLLVEAARSLTLSARLRGQVALAAFIRAILLNN